MGEPAGEHGEMTVAVLRVDAEGRIKAASDNAGEFLSSSVGRLCHRAVAADGTHGRLCTEGCASELASGGCDDPGRRAATVQGRQLALQCHRVGDEVVVCLYGNHQQQAVASLPLTKRQLEVLRLMSEGMTNGEIATRLGVQRCTARTHVEHVLQRLGAHSRTEAVARALATGHL